MSFANAHIFHTEDIRVFITYSKYIIEVGDVKCFIKKSTSWMTNLHLTVEVPGSIFGAGNGRTDCVYFVVLLQL
jgi:hypothetical protein